MWSWLSVALSGYISISANESNNRIQAVVFKTMSMVMLLGIVLGSTTSWTPAVIWLVSGLAVSIGADALYILKRYRKLCFACFLLAQVLYSKSFWSQLDGDIVWWLPILLLALSIVVFLLLLPQIDKLIFPVILMGITLISLNWAAGEVWLTANEFGAFIGFAGTLTLTLSAMLLAIHDYRRPLFLGRYWISGSYILAHSLITASVII